MSVEIRPQRRKGGKSPVSDVHLAFCIPLKRCESGAEYMGYRFEALGMTRSEAHDKIKPGFEAWSEPIASYEARREAARAESRSKFRHTPRRGVRMDEGIEDHGERFADLDPKEAVRLGDAESVGGEGEGEGFDA